MNSYQHILASAALALTLAACGGGSSGGGTVSVVGTWLNTDPATMCENTVIFGADGSFSSAESNETITGTYSLGQTANASGRYPLTITANSDNGGSDCNGDSDDDSGMSLDLFIVVKSDSFDLYETATGGTAALTFLKQ